MFPRIYRIYFLCKIDSLMVIYMFVSINCRGWQGKYLYFYLFLTIGFLIGFFVPKLATFSSKHKNNFQDCLQGVSMESADLVTFTDEILNGKVHYLCSEYSTC